MITNEKLNELARLAKTRGVDLQHIDKNGKICETVEESAVWEWACDLVDQDACAPWEE